MRVHAHNKDTHTHVCVCIIILCMVALLILIHVEKVHMTHEFAKEIIFYIFISLSKLEFMDIYRINFIYIIFSVYIKYFVNNYAIL